jgi:trimeric autotransporter adhesin
MRISLRICGSVLLLCSVLNAQKPSVVTVAGGYQGNHKPALSASFAFPMAVAFDTAGALYIGDSFNCEIRKIGRHGSVEVVAGTGICGFGGDGGKATSAMLSSTIGGMLFDGTGNLLFSDSSNMRIRKITPAGVISTVAGTGTLGYFGDGGPATQAQFFFPQDLALDNLGNVYVADTDNYVVRQINTAGIINTVAGNHTLGYSGDGGLATAAQLATVKGLAVDGNGNLYIGDGASHVREVNTAGVVTTIAGNGQGGNAGDGGPGTAAAIGGVMALLVNGNTLTIATGSSVWLLDLSTDTIHLAAGSAGATGFAGDGGAALSAVFAFPNGIATDSQGNLFLADSGNDRIREISATSQTVTTIAGGYLGDGHKATEASLNLQSLGSHIAFDNSGNLYIAETASHRVRRISTKGVITSVAGTGTMGYSGDGGTATAAQLSHPSAVVVDSVGNLYISDSLNGVIRKVDTTGTISTLHPNGIPLFGPYIFETGAGMAIDAADNIYFSDGLTVIWKMDPSGNANIAAGVLFGFGYGGDGGPATQALMLLPEGIALDATGNLYIADWLNNRIRKVDTAGIITTIAGTGAQGFSGDGGPATAATLNLPVDVTADSAGNVYIADWINFRIRKVDAAGTIQTFVGTGGFGYTGERVAPNLVDVFPSSVALDANGQLYFGDSQSYRVRTIGK